MLFEFTQPQRILVIRLDNIGDVIMTGPFLRALHQAYPEATITLLASPGGSQAAALLPWVDDVIVWRALWQEIKDDHTLNPFRELRLVDLLKERSFDAAFILTSFSQSPYPPAYACYLAGIPYRVAQSKEFGGAALSHWVRPLPDRTHQVDRNLHLLEAFDIPTQGSHLDLQVPSKDRQDVNNLLLEQKLEAGEPYIVLAPGASSATRRYDMRRYAVVAEALVEETGLPLLLVGTQKESERFKPLLELSHRKPKVVSLVGKTSVPGLAAVIEGAELLVTNNSASMHIADAFNRPEVVLFAGTEVLEQWEPRNAPARLLNRSTHCSPCYRFECPYHLECLDIPAKEVVYSALQLMQEPEPLPVAPLK